MCTLFRTGAAGLPTFMGGLSPALYRYAEQVTNIGVRQAIEISLLTGILSKIGQNKK